MSARTPLAIGLLGVLSLAVADASAQTFNVDETTGYIRMSDGIELRYTLWLPAGQPGPFPVIVNYSGYSPGTTPDSSVHGALDNRLSAQGVAVLGVNVRGTGCSTGYWDLFEPRWGQDGYEIVEWAAAQPWSNGRVGYYGISFPGITQLMAGATRPPHLTAIAPNSLVRDVYRDVGFPGGIPNQNFATLFVAIQEAPGAQEVPGAVIIDSDEECAANYTTREGTDGASNVALLQAQHPYDDAFVQRRAPGKNVDKIQVPTFVFHQWQDEQTGPRFAGDFDQFDPDLTWFVASNGDHSFPSCGTCTNQLEDFFQRYLLDASNNWEDTPHVQLWYDSTTSRQRIWSLEYDEWPPPTDLHTLYLREGGALDPAAPTLPEAVDTYEYPGVGSSTAYPGPQQAWQTSALLQTGFLAYETAPFSEDRVFFGPGSLDLFFSATGTDLDFQITLTEIRPDGQEVFIQRGYLRASHRALDPALSTATRPYHTHQEADAQLLLDPLEVVEARIEIFPFSHAVRQGSRLRLWIDAPTTQTGYWGFRYVPDPSLVSVYHDPTHPSKLVLGVLPGETAGAPLPACNSQMNQPCRPDPL